MSGDKVGGKVWRQDGVVLHALFKARRVDKRLGPAFAVFIVTNAFHNGPDAEFQGADVRYIINLEERQGFSMALQKTANLILEEGVRSTAKARHFHEVDGVVLTGYPVSGF